MVREIFFSVDRDQGGEHQKSCRQSVSAWVVACLAFVTLIKDCKPNFEFTQYTNYFFTFLGPTGLLDTNVLFKEYKLFTYVYQLIQNFVTGSY